MANIISIGTAVPQFCHKQEDILHFMQKAYGLDETDKRKLSYLYNQSCINTRYSIISDFGGSSGQGMFMPGTANTAAPSLDERMRLYAQEALPLSVAAIYDCLADKIEPAEITHLITVSCTGMSAPGLDLQLYEALGLSPNVYRTSVNFMGCYAAIHALKMAHMICNGQQKANVVIVTTELCTLHFQNEFTPDNAASSLLFADGSAAVLVSNHTDENRRSLKLQSFFSQVSLRGKADMSWDISSKGFLMKLSAYIPQLIKEDIAALVTGALNEEDLQVKDITHWCIHPGGKKILEVIQKQLGLCDCKLAPSRSVLAQYGNMSSATILFVMKEMMANMNGSSARMFGVAFGPGLTMETFIATT